MRFQLATALATQRPGLKVLYMSGYVGSALTDRGEFEPGQAFLDKPFTPSSLIQHVREALDAH